MKKQRFIEFPTTWDELTSDDWREVLKIRHTVVTTDHQWTAEDIRIETARALLKCRGVKTQINNPKYLELLARLQQSLTWLWPVEGSIVSLSYRSTVNLMPRVRDWLGPMSHGEDLMFGEFRQAMAALRTFESPAGETPEKCNELRQTALQALAGLLYRPAATDSQRHMQQLRRQPYDWDSLNDQVKRGAQMKPWQVWGIYAWFAYFCEYLTEGVFIIGGCEVCFAPLFEKSASGGLPVGSPSNSLQQICLTLAESHVFGNYRDVEHTPLLTVMQKLLQDYETLKKVRSKR